MLLLVLMTTRTNYKYNDNNKGSTINTQHLTQKNDMLPSQSSSSSLLLSDAGTQRDMINREASYPIKVMSSDEGTSATMASVIGKEGQKEQQKDEEEGDKEEEEDKAHWEVVVEKEKKIPGYWPVSRSWQTRMVFARLHAHCIGPGSGWWKGIGTTTTTTSSSSSRQTILSGRRIVRRGVHLEPRPVIMIQKTTKAKTPKYTCNNGGDDNFNMMIEEKAIQNSDEQKKGKENTHTTFTTTATSLALSAKRAKQQQQQQQQQQHQQQQQQHQQQIFTSFPTTIIKPTSNVETGEAVPLLDAGVCVGIEMDKVAESDHLQKQQQQQQQRIMEAFSSSSGGKLTSISDNNNPIRFGCLPSAIIIGTQKGGTAELQLWLSQHPLLLRWGGARRSGTGEAHFFDKLIDMADLERRWLNDYVMTGFGVKDTSELLNAYTFEKTPRYLAADAEKVKLMHALIPSVRLIAILRAPSARAYSHFQHKCAQNRVFRVRTTTSTPTTTSTTSTSTTATTKTSNRGGGVPLAWHGCVLTAKSRTQAAAILRKKMAASFGGGFRYHGASTTRYDDSSSSSSSSSSSGFLLPNHQQIEASLEVLEYPCAPADFDALLLRNLETGEWDEDIVAGKVADGGILRRGRYSEQLSIYRQCELVS